MAKIAVIGGIGEFGSMFARIFREEGNDVLVTGRNKETGKKVSKSLGVGYKRSNIEAAEWADVVIISVSIENTLDVIKEIAPHVRDGSLLMDFTSVKVEPCRAMLKYSGKKVEIIGTHPMFSPRVIGLEGLVFIVTPVRAEKWMGWLKEWLEDKKAKVIITTPEEHDKIISVVQGLTHFTYLSVASTLAEMKIDVKETRKFASPIYELMIDLIARIIGQNPRLYAGIQMLNPEAKKVRRVFIDRAIEFNNIIDRKDKDAFVKEMVTAARHLGDIKDSMGRSDKAIMALNQELLKLKESVGKEVALRHIYSGNVHVGTVRKVDGEMVTLGRGKKKITIKISNLELLSHEEFIKWKLNNLPREKRDYSIIFSETTDEETICRVLKKMFEGLAECMIIDIYRGKNLPEGMKSITLRLEGVNTNFKDIEEFLKGLGGKIR
ncbi:T-protein [archaeon]|nr:T-protein [archaeon]